MRKISHVNLCTGRDMVENTAIAVSREQHDNTQGRGGKKHVTEKEGQPDKIKYSK
jgi:hypothetical protein